MIKITVQLINKAFPQNKQADKLAADLEALFPKYDINTKNRVAGFLAQCGHESNGFTVLKENLNYSADSLNKVFKKYFPTVNEAAAYARQPEKIANKVYANRLGNGPESSGDGFKYRGRGAIQLTGKDNYSKFAASIGKSLDETVTYCETLEGALESACWFWKTNGLNKFCDADDIVGMSKKVNGGTIGLEDRTKHYTQIKGLL